MTEKDAVKYRESGRDLWSVPAEIQMPKPVEQAVLSKVLAVLPGERRG